MDAVTRVPTPANEPALDYGANSPDRDELLHRVRELQQGGHDLPCVVGGARRAGGGRPAHIVQPHRHAAALGEYRHAAHNDALDAVAAARRAAPAWQALSYDDRAAIFLRAAEMLAGPWRSTLNAATMLGQSKTAAQAEIDSACELIDFWRFNVAFGRQILEEQPHSPLGVWNQLDYRPLEGFVYAITPFNFTAIAGNLPSAPALMGNVVIWKPAEAQLLAAQMTMQLLEAAGLPPGVINLLTGDGRDVSEVLLASHELAGLHFTGSTATFNALWRAVGNNLDRYRSYPRLVGETGGKDFVLAHPSADVDALRRALVLGAFEYQGQKCSAASRAYIPSSLWPKLRDDLADETASLPMGDVADLSNFLGAVIDRRSFDRLEAVLRRTAGDSDLRVLVGGEFDDSIGYFVRPTVILSADPNHEIFRNEFFGPILAVHVYDDSSSNAFAEIIRQVDRTGPYGLTGSLIGSDRAALRLASDRLRFAAGNLYINDKPTGAVVGQQPFGGGRSSGTNDKAGSLLNLMRWTSPRTIKEAFTVASSSPR